MACILKTHEVTIGHLQGKVRWAMYINNQRVDIVSFKELNSKVVKNQEIVKVIMEALIYLLRQNLAFGEHDESQSSKNQGNFFELIKLLSKQNAVLSSHLANILNNNKKN